MVDTDFDAPGDAELLFMENDLLSHEVRFLRARIDELEHERAQGGDSEEMEDLRRYAIRLRSEVAELKKAHSDLRWFIIRLDESVGGWLFRRWEGFRVLRRRWVTGPDGDSS